MSLSVVTVLRAGFLYMPTSVGGAEVLQRVFGKPSLTEPELDEALFELVAAGYELEVLERPRPVVPDGARVVEIRPEGSDGRWWFVAHRSTHDPGRVQLTQFGGDELAPWGHTTWGSMQEAVESACGLGPLPVGSVRNRVVSVRL